MEEREMIAFCREFLDGQKLKNKLSGDGKTVFFKKGEDTYELMPCNGEGNTQLGKVVILNIDNLAELARVWAQAVHVWSLDPMYDSFEAVSMNLSMPPNQPAGRKKCFVWYKFDTFEDFRATATDPQNFHGILEKLHTLAGYIIGADKK